MADYAGWVKSAAERVINLLGSREGITTVYGDVHNGCIMLNEEHRLCECCFGPIGRSSGRSPKTDFGSHMQDYDGRSLQVYALYHADYASPSLKQQKGPFYWNFMEMEFDPWLQSPTTKLTIRNLIDAPDEDPRGGTALILASKDTGRLPASEIPATIMIPSADVQISSLSGELIRGTRTDVNGTMPLTRLNSVMPDTPLLVTAYSDEKAVSLIIRTTSLTLQ